MDAALLTAIDVHVHLEHTGELTAADRQAQQYFGAGGVARDWDQLAEYYRSRKLGCVVFPVDERLTGQVWVTVVATGLGGSGRRSGTPSLVSALTAPEDELEPPSFLRN